MVGLEKKTILKLHLTVVTLYDVQIAKHSSLICRICNVNRPCCGSKVEILVSVSVGSSTRDDESRARCSMPLLHIHYIKNCGNLTQDPAYCSAHSL